MCRFVAFAMTALVTAFSTAEVATAHLASFNGTLELQLGALPPIVATGAGQMILNGSASEHGHLTTLQIGANTVSAPTSVIVPVTDPDAAPLVSIRGTMALGTGILRPISGAVASGGGLTQNVLPVAGALRLCTLLACSSFLSVPLTVGGTRGVGIGGLITAGTFGQSGIKVSLINAPWTVKTAVVTGITTDNGGFSTQSRFGFAHGPASFTSSTNSISGVVQLVTPIVLQTTIPGMDRVASFGRLTLHHTPEPGTFLLFGTGVVALCIGGRRRIGKK